VVSERDADVRADGVVLSRRRHYVIFNPASGRGRGERNIAGYRALLEDALPDVTFAETTRPGEERDLSERAVAEGYDVIVAVGGDGTWSNVAEGLLSSGRSDVALAILPNGTGNDFGRNFGYHPSNQAEAVRVVAEGWTRTVDVGRVESPSTGEQGPERFEPRYFLNLIGFGFDIAVIDAAAGARFLKGELLYKVTALQQLFRFPGVRMRLTGSGGADRERELLMLTVSNAKYFGGGFPIAPGAEIDDGRLHACLIGDAPPLARLKLFNLAEKGRHVTSERVEVLDDDAFRVRFDEPPRFELDGEMRRAEDTTVDMRILPGALRIVAPAPDGPATG